MDIGGDVAPGYEAVRDAFVANFDRGEEVGASVAVYKDGLKVVDLWGGVANQDTGAPWVEDTMQVTFSTTKGATAACAHLLAQRGLLDFDAPAAEYWPEFAAEGKADIPVRWLLSHRSGLPAVDTPLTPEQLYAWDPIVDALAAQKPYWEPGTKHGYHALTYGYLVGEVIRRISGKSVGQFFRDEIAGPLGVDYYIGLPAELEPRVGKLVTFSFAISDEQRAAMKDMELTAFPEETRELIAAFLDPESLPVKALNLTQPGIDFNAPEMHAADIPAANGIGTARGLARMYASFVGEVDGMRTLSPATIDRARTEQSAGKDAVLVRDTRFG
ncbi:MAG TPA: serine hydrolase domain-containing protein, partial [Acidimicrobiales bacterium]|nr:serine hydrolase domain-containing protein [Acidimicrobiales bacterium]